MLPSDMNLRIGNVRNYNNKILISSPSFKIGTNLKINLDVKSKEVKTEPNKEHKQDVKSNIKFDRESNQNVKKPEVKSKEVDNRRLMVKSEPKVITKPNKEHKQDVKPNIKFDTNEITYEEEKVALVLGITSVFTVWWMFK